MPAPVGSAAHVDDPMPIWCQAEHTHDDVDDRVERAHLVELHVLDVDAVDVRLGDGDPVDDRDRPLGDRGWEISPHR